MELEAVSVTAGQTELLSQVDLRVAPGEKVALVGESGSGKSTLLRLLGGAISNGVDDDNLRHHHYRTEQAVHVDQDCHLLPRSTKPEELGGLVQLRLPAQVATRVSSDDRLSGGQRRRVAVVRAFSLHRPVIVLDEPTAGLDRAATDAIADLITTSNATIVVATHEERVAAACERVIHLADRRIVASGTHEELLRTDERYRTLWGVHTPLSVSAVPA